jgi:AcrR family transcriptional regulator
MDAVARVAHVSKTTLYAHYPSRHALLVAVVADEAAQFDPALGTPPDTLEDLATDLERFVLSLHEFLTDNRHAISQRCTVTAHSDRTSASPATCGRRSRGVWSIAAMQIIQQNCCWA